MNGNGYLNLSYDIFSMLYYIGQWRHIKALLLFYSHYLYDLPCYAPQHLLLCLLVTKPTAYTWISLWSFSILLKYFELRILVMNCNLIKSQELGHRRDRKYNSTH
ncbi:hypothetical protein YC2023_036411 [Brassica napus]|uniref:(rape) hypothetical protein n=1 Tax=Brassica napus TaxID=3708 RepID=A0A816I816_BRANA|nr:unnamed protein product [Brassica napus]